VALYAVQFADERIRALPNLTVHLALSGDRAGKAPEIQELALERAFAQELRIALQHDVV
jgi:hypothetical protein